MKIRFALLIGFNLIILTSPLFAQAPIGSGNSVNFNGSAHHISCGNDASLNIANGTIELWFSLNTLINSTNANLQTLIAKNVASWNAGDIYLWWHLSRNRGHIEFGFEQTGNTRSTLYSIANTWNANEWHHIAITWITNGAMRMYIDGIDQGGTATTNIGLQASSGDFRIFGDIVNNGFTNGRVDEVRVWNIARTLPQIQSDMCKQLDGTEIGLVGYWNMNEGTGTIINDLTSNSNDGTIQ